MAKLESNSNPFPILGQTDTRTDASADALDLFGPKEPAALRGIAKIAATSPVVDQGHRVDFHALEVRSILNRTKSRRGFTFARSINPYRGCEFACQYCYARYTHEFMELRDPHAFESQIYIKQHAAWLLQQELGHLGPEEAIAIGTATDPYQPIERTARITRSLLEVLCQQRGRHIGIVTKSTLIARDIDLLQRIHANNRLTLNITITTMDANMARSLEPRAPRPDLRMATVTRLRKAGLRAGVLCCPLLPGITDTYAAIESVASAASKAGAIFFHANPLFLKPCSKHVFEEYVQQHFPELLGAYQARYEKSAFVSGAYRKRIAQMVEAIQQKYRLGWRYEEVATQPRQHFRKAQMELFNEPTSMQPKTTRPNVSRRSSLSA
ncbi:MAG TPA: radical SAM protein [Acidobacteriaceae bacterium]|jgi:DNA repair photolyase|nr:radical SAM protein [Acidobacteriaceae bacterium]